MLPYGPGKMPTDDISLLVIKQGFRSFKNPAFGTADVDLKAAGVGDEDEF